MQIIIQKDEVIKNKIILISNSPRILLFFDGEKYFSFNGICPHAKWPLELGNIEKNKLTCGGHSWEFDITNGECTSNPGRDLIRYDIIESEKEVIIST